MTGRSLTRLALVVAVLASASHAWAQGALSMQGDRPVQFTADEFSCDDARGQCHAVGHVTLVSGGTLLNADSLLVDYEKVEGGARRVTGALAVGDVLLVDGDTMTTCERIQLDPDLVQGTLGLAEIRVKRPGTVGALKGWDAFGAGSDMIYFNGKVRRTGPKTFHISDVYFTPCDCGPDNIPLFSIHAKSADVTMGDHAVFYRPNLQPADTALPVPFSLPALYLPLSKRKTGLLPSTPRTTSDGFYMDLQYFWAPRSDFDLTFGAGVSAGRGFRAPLELNYAPSTTTSGTLRGWYFYDLTYALQRLGPTPTEQAKKDFGPELGANRFTLSSDHRSGTYERLSWRHHVDLVSDVDIMYVVGQNFASRATNYLPSRAVLDYRGDAWRASMGVASYQDFTPTVQSLFSATARRTVDRLPDIAFNLAPTEIGAGLKLGFDSRLVSMLAPSAGGVASYGRVEDPSKPGSFIEQVNLSPTLLPALARGDQPVDCATLNAGGHIDPALPSTTTGIVADARTTAAAKAANAQDCIRILRGTRADIVPRLSRQFDLGGLKVRPELFGLAAVGATAVDNTVTARGFAGASLDLSTHIGRVFDAGEDLSVRHRIRPTAKYLLIPTTWGQPTYAMDERDVWRAAHQLAVGFDTDLYAKQGQAGATRAVALRLTQGLNLPLGPNNAPLGLGELAGNLAITYGPVWTNLSGALNPTNGHFYEYSADSRLLLGPLGSLRVNYYRIFAGGSRRMNTGLFELLPTVRTTPAAGSAHSIYFEINLQPIKSLQLVSRLGLGLPDDRTNSAGQLLQPGAYLTTVTPQNLYFRVGYTGVCGCFGVGVEVTLSRPEQFAGTLAPTILPTLYFGDFAFNQGTIGM